MVYSCCSYIGPCIEFRNSVSWIFF